jgi:hypothetical protein
VRAGINPPPRQPTGDDNPSLGEIPAQPLPDLIPRRGRTTRPHNRDQMPTQKFNVSEHIQEVRRIVNLAKPGQLLRLVPGKQPHARCQRGGSFFGGVAQGRVRMDCLCDGCWQSLGLEFRERSIEYRLRAAHFAGATSPPCARPIQESTQAPLESSNIKEGSRASVRSGAG